MNLHGSSTSFSHGEHWPLKWPGDIFLSMGHRLSPPRRHQHISSDWVPESHDEETTGCTLTRSQRGMTLVEILVVLALIGIAALVAVSNLQTVQRRFQLENGVRNVTAFLNEAPNFAKQLNTSVFLIWDGTARGFTIATDAAGTNVLDTFTIPEELTIAGPGAPVLRCDVYGRVFVGTATTMMTTLQTMSLTHRDTPEASAPTYVLSLSPLWAIQVNR